MKPKYVQMLAQIYDLESGEGIHFPLMEMHEKGHLLRVAHRYTDNIYAARQQAEGWRIINVMGMKTKIPRCKQLKP